MALLCKYGASAKQPRPEVILAKFRFCRHKMQIIISPVVACKLT